MTVDIPLFLIGLLLLWFPRRWMRRGAAFLQRRKKSAESTRTEPWKNREPGDPRIGFVAEFGKFRNYIDLLRAGTGSLMLWGGLGMPAALALAAGSSRGESMKFMALRALLRLIGVLVQSIRYEKKHLSFYPPIFYLAGVSLALSDPRGAAFAFILVWAINSALPNAQAFLSAYAFLIAVFGLFFSRRMDLSVILAAVLCFLPVLMSLLANRQLMVFTRKAARTGARP